MCRHFRAGWSGSRTSIPRSSWRSIGPASLTTPFSKARSSLSILRQTICAVSNVNATQAQAPYTSLHRESSDRSLHIRPAAHQESESPRCAALRATKAARELHQAITPHSFVELHRELGYCRRRALLSPSSWLWSRRRRDQVGSRPLPRRQAGLAADQVQKRISKTVVVGAIRGKGHRAGSYGSLLLASFDPATNRYYSLTKVGAGFSDKLLRSLPRILKPYVIREKHRLVDTGMTANVWFEPVKVVEVAGAELTISPVHSVAHHLVPRRKRKAHPQLFIARPGMQCRIDRGRNGRPGRKVVDTWIRSVR